MAWPLSVQRVSEFRALEPTGLLGLAKAQIHLQQWTNARATLEQLLAKPWPPRFGDVHAQVRGLLNQCPK
jgi:hypothetical protein